MEDQAQVAVPNVVAPHLQSGHGLIGAATAVKANELERMANVLSRQDELIRVLDDRLGVVSVPEPGNDRAQREPNLHISFFVDLLDSHNARLQSLINKLVI